MEVEVYWVELEGAMLMEKACNCLELLSLLVW